MRFAPRIAALALLFAVGMPAASLSSVAPGIVSVRRPERVALDASDPSLPTPLPPRDTLRAGEVVTLRWRPPGVRIEECELLMSLDGGRTFALRISPELDGHSAAFEWRVPDLAASDVRICIRARIGGREINGPAGAPLTLVRGEGAAEPAWSFRETGYGPPAEPAPDTNRLRNGRELRASRPVAVFDAPARFVDTAPEARTRRIREESAHPDPQGRAGHFAHIPRFQPRRE